MENKKQDVSCTAEDCIYNSRSHCTADHISVSGHGAKKARETECDTFCGRDCRCGQ